MNEALIIHWPYFLLALAMLWFPRQWLRLGKRLFKRRRRAGNAIERIAGRGSRDPDDQSIQPRREFATFRNYLDLFRGLAGGYSLSTFAFAPSGHEAEAWALGLQAFVLFVAVLIQTLRTERNRHHYFAPIFWFVGLSAGFPGHYAGLFSFALVLAINPALPNPRLFLSAFAVFLVLTGFLFGAPLKLIALTAGLILLVPLASLLAKRPVVVFTRKPQSARA